MAVAVAWLSIASGCDPGGVAVLPGKQDAYGRADLLAAIKQFTGGERSPERFRELAATIDALRPRFDEVVREEAELHLVVLALSPLTAHSEQAPDQQMAALGLTVWPSAFGVAPDSDESVWQYGERLCGGALALECKYVVPEYRALVLSGVVWDRFRERAYDAISECDGCRGQEAYQKALETYDRYQRDIGSKVTDAESLASPRRWPMAGEHASPWSGAPVLEARKHGHHVLGGRPLAAGELAEALRQLQPDHARLGVLIRASAPVSELRAILREAEGAGFDEVALQVRSSAYPFDLAEYSLATGRERSTVPARDIDTVQILVQALDAAAETGHTAPRI